MSAAKSPTSNNDLKPVSVALTPSQRFEEYLQSRGMRQTEQRKVILDLVFRQHEHFDADDLIDKLPAKGEKHYVSRPTVYRTLGEFVDAGLLRKFELEGRSVYEHDYGYPHHDHLHCTKCGRLIEFQSDALTELRSQLASEHQFRVESHQLIISGTCNECVKNKRRVKRKVDLI